ncbi:MAG: hypothetical protein JXA30_16590 [Deltaproteobacteria bacterium]|nr:hypothetical protein [Deltaproteobacteria bacterium]
MRYEIPKDPKKIRQRIRSYERKLEKELQEFGRYTDGYGKRFFIGPLYLLIDDLEGALKHFQSFECEFGAEEGEPAQVLCWALALYRYGAERGARSLLKLTMQKNLYIIPYLIGEEIVELDIRHGSSDEWPMILNWIPDKYFDMWTDEELAWATAVYRSPEFVEERNRLIEENSSSPHEPKGPEELAEVREIFGLEKQPSRRRRVR